MSAKSIIHVVFSILVILGGSFIDAKAATAFTYQGRLSTSGMTAEGAYDLKFVLYTAHVGGNQIGPILTNTVMLSSNGLFSVPLDFGPVFDGTAYWMEICVRPSGSDTFQPLPRQPVTATPHALYAATSGAALTAAEAVTAQTAHTVVAGAIDEPALMDGAVTGSKIASGYVVRSINGLTDEVSFSAGIGLALEGTSYRVADGGIVTSLLAEGAVTTNKLSGVGAIAGQVLKYDGEGWGFDQDNDTQYAAGAGLSLEGTTLAVDFAGTGGAGTVARSDHDHNLTYALLAHTHSAADITTDTLEDARLSVNVPLLDGHQTFAGSNSFLGAVTSTNDANLFAGTFQGDGGGLTNLLAASLAGTLTDDQLPATLARLDSSPIFSGAVTASSFSGDGGGLTNLSADRLGELAPSRLWQLGGNVGTAGDVDFLGTLDEQPLEIWVHNKRALRLEPTSETANVIFGSSHNSVGPSEDFPGTGIGVVIGGGFSNRMSGPLTGCIIGGGLFNSVSVEGNNPVQAITIAGGYRNHVSGDEWFAGYAVIGGGAENYISADEAGGDSTTISGGRGNRIHGADSAVVGGGRDNEITHAAIATIGGGLENRIDYDPNFGSNYGESYSTISGGRGNQIFGFLMHGTIGGGARNLLEHYDEVSGGTISGGEDNAAAGIGPTIGGGVMNTIRGDYATIPGGKNNTADGSYSFAAGTRAKANHTGAFVWADSSDFDFVSTNANQFSARCVGGARFVSSIDVDGTPLAGVHLEAGSGSWSSLSDRNVKENFRSTEPREVLERLRNVPILTWNYRSQADAVRHMGPTAQDFHAAFGVGESDRHISSVDADGVALAAIQGLNQKVEEQAARIRALEEMVAGLVERLKPSQPTEFVVTP